MDMINKAIVIGNLGQDPDLRYTPSGAAVCTLSIATTEVRKDQSGKRIENTEWHKVIVWNKPAENCAKYLSKGRSVYVEGRIKTRSWDDQGGQKRYSTEIVAQTIQFIGGAKPEANRSQESDVQQSFGEPESVSLDDIPF